MEENHIGFNWIVKDWEKTTSNCATFLCTALPYLHSSSFIVHGWKCKNKVLSNVKWPMCPDFSQVSNEFYML